MDRAARHMDRDRTTGRPRPTEPEPARALEPPLVPGVSSLMDGEGRSIFVADNPAAVLFRFTDRLYRATHMREIYPAALEAIMSAMGCSRAAVLLADQDFVMRFVAWHDLSSSYRASVEGHSPWPMDDPDPSPVYISNVEEADIGAHLKAVVLGERIYSVCFIPLMANGRLIGKFMAYHDKPDGFTPDDQTLGLVIARQLAFSIERQENALKTKDAEEALKAADRRKDEFLAILAHELRNPLGSISLSLEVLALSKNGDQAWNDAHQIIRRQTSHLTRLVDDLLDITRVVQGKLELRLGPVELCDIVGAAVELSRPLLDRKHQTLRISMPDGSVVITADAGRLAQALSNLISNASKYSDGGGLIWLDARVLPTSVELTVRDQGIGISADFLPRIFDLFSQEEDAVLRSAGGLGIGLNLVKRLVRLHGGTVEARSPGTGKGSSFIIRLPR
ncbi:MAG TPA: GAF domain-containing sensor histidine kinase [Prosthecobacter sp.]